jgi:hypothetical protein
LDGSNSLRQSVIGAAYEGATENVAVTAEVFGGRVHHYIRAKFERTLKHGRSPGVVDRHDGTALVG